MSTESAEGSRSHPLPSVFLTHRCFPLLSIVSKKINGGEGTGDKEGRTRGRQFLSATSEARSPLCFLAAKARDQVRPLRVQLYLLLQKEQFPAASAGSFGSWTEHRSIVNVPISDFTEEERGLWLHSWERLLLQTCHTAVVKKHKQEVVKIPSKIPGSEEMLRSINVLLAFFISHRFFLATVNPQTSGTCC